jgi:hypothetical protein
MLKLEVIDLRSMWRARCTISSLFHFAGKVDTTLALAVSRRNPTAAARVRSHIKWCGISGGEGGTGAGLLGVLLLPLLILIPPNAPCSSIIRWCYGRLIGPRTKWSQIHPTPSSSSSSPVAPTWNIGHQWNTFFSLQFLNLRQSLWLLGRGISPS